MPTEQLYLDDPFRTEFEAEVVEQTNLTDGRKGVLLAQTYFYPTGGGQEHDTGTLGAARVADVLIDEAGNIIHVVEGEVGGVRVPAQIDWARRFANMQHHSAQHILSEAFQQALGLETISSRISIDSPTTIDLLARELDDADLTHVENLANAVLFEDRAIKSYFVTDAEVHTIPLRRPPKVQGQIRIVEVEGFDYSACGGTHCARAGMIGVIKILKAERRGEQVRIYFIAGDRALRYFQESHRLVTNAVRLLNANPEAVVGAIERQQEQLRAVQKELQELKAELVPLEVRKLVERAEPLDALKLVLASFRERPVAEIRALGMLLQNEPGVVALLAAYDGAKLSLTVTCASDTGMSANELMRKQLAEIGGRGGGDARLAQGGGAATEAQFESFFAHAREYVAALRQRE